MRDNVQGQNHGYLSIIDANPATYSLIIAWNGLVTSLEVAGKRGEWPEVDRDRWRKDAVGRGRRILNKLGIQQPIGSPLSWSVEPNFPLFYPRLFNGLRIGGSKFGYEIQMVGKNFDLVGFRRHEEVPTLPANRPTISMSQAKRIAEAAYRPPKPIQDIGGEQYNIGKPELCYYWSETSSGPARLAWFMLTQHYRSDSLSVKGHSFDLYIDALTGKLLTTDQHSG